MPTSIKDYTLSFQAGNVTAEEILIIRNKYVDIFRFNWSSYIKVKAFKCKGRDANERLLDIHNAMYVLAIVVGDTSY